MSARDRTNRERNCCDGLCNQGHACPRYERVGPDRRPQLSIARVYGWGAVYVCCITTVVGFWWAVATYGDGVRTALRAWLGVA